MDLARPYKNAEVVANQGAEMNVISLGLALDMHLTFYDGHVGAKHKGMKMRTANGGISYLNKFVIFNLAIEKI